MSPERLDAVYSSAELSAHVIKLKKDLLEEKFRTEAALEQFRRDKVRIELDKAKLNEKYLLVCRRLMLAEGKKRFQHQVDRDENFVLNIVSKIEFDEVSFVSFFAD